MNQNKYFQAKYDTDANYLLTNQQLAESFRSWHITYCLFLLY